MAGDLILEIKRGLAREVLASVSHLGGTIAASVLQIDDARMSDLRHGRFALFSLERLVRMLATVNREVALTVTATDPRPVAWFRLLRERRARGEVRPRRRRGRPKQLRAGLAKLTPRSVSCLTCRRRPHAALPLGSGFS